MAISELAREANERRAAARGFFRSYLRPLQTHTQVIERRIKAILARKQGLPSDGDLQAILQGMTRLVQLTGMAATQGNKLLAEAWRL